MKRHIFLTAASIAACALFASCSSTKQRSNDYIFGRYLKTGKEKFRTRAVEQAIAQMPSRLPVMKYPGADHQKAYLVLFRTWNEDKLLNYLYAKNFIDCDSLGDDDELRPSELRNIIDHDERIMQSLPDGIRTDLADIILTKNQDIFWAKALKGDENLAARIAREDFSPHAVHMYLACTGDTTLVAMAARRMTRDAVERYRLGFLLPEEKKVQAKTLAKKPARLKTAAKKTKKKVVKKSFQKK